MGRRESPLATLLRRAVILALAAPAAACGADDDTPHPVDVGSDATLAGDIGSSDAGDDADLGSDAADTDDGERPPTSLWDAGCEPIRDPALGDECNDGYRLPCGLPKDFPVGVIEPIGCYVICPPPEAGTIFTCATALDDAGDGGALLACTHCATGRRPVGLRPCRTPHASSPEGLFFARVAELEAASIDAFATLRRELRAHGAPRRLVHAAARARRDEVRHARSMGLVARARGGRPRLPRTMRQTKRTLAELARENVVEGCVRETYGAAVAMFQAARAPSPAMRARLAAIAVDETEHARFSRDLAFWLWKRIGRRARSELTRRADEAVRGLRDELARSSVSTELARAAGMPTREESLRLFDAVFAPGMLTACPRSIRASER